MKSDFLLFPIPLISICITLAFTYCNKINWLIHDIRRHLASIDTLAAAKETDKIHDYIRQLQTSSSLKSVQRVIDRYDGAIKMYFDLPTLTFHTILTLRPEKC